MFDGPVVSMVSGCWGVVAGLEVSCRVWGR